MKKLVIAVAAVIALSGALPAAAADYSPPVAMEPAPPVPMTCMDRANEFYQNRHFPLLWTPVKLGHAALCHVFHHDERPYW